MGMWLTVAIVLQLACAVCAARLRRPAIWLQIVLLVPLFGSLAYCAFEILRATAADRRPAPDRRLAARADMHRLVMLAVRARSAEGRRALAEECMRLGRHADARLLFQSCPAGPDAGDDDLMARHRRAAGTGG